MVCPFLYGGNRDAPNFAKLCAIRSKWAGAKKQSTTTVRK